MCPFLFQISVHLNICFISLFFLPSTHAFMMRCLVSLWWVFPLCRLSSTTVSTSKMSLFLPPLVTEADTLFAFTLVLTSPVGLVLRATRHSVSSDLFWVSVVYYWLIKSLHVVVVCVYLDSENSLWFWRRDPPTDSRRPSSSLSTFSTVVSRATVHYFNSNFCRCRAVMAF